MADDAPGAMPVRGTLKVEIGTSSTVLEAGRPFSVLVTIQNPFDVPVEITAVTTVVPIEFIDLERRKYEHERDQSLSRAQKIADDMLKDISPDLPSDKKKRAITELILSAAHMLPIWFTL